MGFLKNAKSVASTLFSSRKKDAEAGVVISKSSHLDPQASHLRGEAKKTWTVRKREFDKLRALRQNDSNNYDKSKQRFSNTSMLTDLSEKASTIKKINDIEAQMSMQWWKTDRLDFNLQEASSKPRLIE